MAKIEFGSANSLDWRPTSRHFISILYPWRMIPNLGPFRAADPGIAAHTDRPVIGADDFIAPTDGAARGSQSFDETRGILDRLPPEIARKLGRGTTPGASTA